LALNFNDKSEYTILFSWREWQLQSLSLVPPSPNMKLNKKEIISQSKSSCAIFQFQHTVWNCWSPNCDAVS